MTPRDVEAPGTVAAADRAHGTPSTNAAIVADAAVIDKGVVADAACLDKPERKRLDTLAAQLALRGYELHTLASGEFLVSSWGLRKFCRTLADVEDFARQAGALR